jgi:hypothetical protein
MSSYKKAILVTVPALIISAGGAYAYTQNQKTEQHPEDIMSEQEVNYGPPTNEEKEQAEQHKKDLASQPPELQPTTGTKKQVTPVITVWGQNPQDKSAEANGYVSDIYEDGGNCTLTLEKDGHKKTASRKGFKDAQTTSCGLLTIPRSSLSAGTWHATLAYNSTIAQGTSESMSIKIE